MKIKNIPLSDVVTIAKIVQLEADDEDEENPFINEEGLGPGTYAMDGEARVWKLEEAVTSLFQEFMDAGVNRTKSPRTREKRPPTE